MNMEHFLERELAGETKYLEKTFPNTALSTTNFTWRDLKSNPEYRSGNPASGSFEQGNEHSRIVERGECLDQMSNC
jgi:hypothetical protein